MASSGYRKRVSPRTGRVSYQVWWRMEDGSQGARTVSTRDEAKELLDEKRLEMRRGTWRGRRRGRLPFSHWADEWWSDWSADPHRSPTTLVMAESRLRRTCARSSETDPSSGSGRPTCVAGRRNLPVRSAMTRWCAVPLAGAAHPPVRHRRRRDRGQPGPQGAATQAPGRPRGRLCRGEAPRPHARGSRAAAGLLPPVLVGPCHHPARHRPALRRAGGLRRRRVHLDRPVPVLEVGPTRYQAGRFGSGFKPRPKSDAGIRQVPLAPLVVEAIRRQLPTRQRPRGPGVHRPGRRRRPGGRPKGTRTVLSRHNFWRTLPGCRGQARRPGHRAATDRHPAPSRLRGRRG